MDTNTAKKLLDKTKSDYAKIVVGFDETRSNAPHFRADLGQLVSLVEKGDKILDLGCGNGRLYKFLQFREAEYLGVDNSEPLIAKAREKFPDAKFLVGDALDLGFLVNEKFNKIFLVATLQHIPSGDLRLKVLENIREVLTTDGMLIMTNWNLYQPKYLPQIIKYSSLRAARRMKIDRGDIFIPWHTKKEVVQRYYHAFTSSETRDLLIDSGFKVIDLYYVKNGQRTNWIHGANLVAIARKE